MISIGLRNPNVSAVNPLIKSGTKSGTKNGTKSGTIIEQKCSEAEIIFNQTCEKVHQFQYSSSEMRVEWLMEVFPLNIPWNFINFKYWKFGGSEVSLILCDSYLPQSSLSISFPLRFSHRILKSPLSLSPTSMGFTIISIWEAKWWKNSSIWFWFRRSLM